MTTGTKYKMFKDLNRTEILILVQDYCNATVIQYTDKTNGVWRDLNVNSELCFMMTHYYRIKPEID